ncbi:hypothetical protein M231_02197 [Tremella mesenterica]|uniref:G-patch domain-containing protein n=1 Tax=Tremella mesenterica TaxID=5217 RepID=A0A4Q1BRD7_TREME|nr:hypothetical protein M231_02197 [Tremella mesenterica]
MNYTTAGDTFQAGPSKWRAPPIRPAVVIRSTPPTSDLQHVHIHGYTLPQTPQDLASSLPALFVHRSRTDQKEWREWYLNPTRHGKEKQVLPPVFVPSEGTYDELGRSSAEGVTVEIGGGAKLDNHADRGNGKDTSEWYLSISNEGTRTSSPPSRTIPLPTIPQASTSNTSKEDQVSEGSQTRKPGRDHDGTKVKPLRIHKNEWFIRRALLSKSRSYPSSAQKPAQTTSIGGMLDMKPQPKIRPAHYVLGPENKGWALLEGQGWSGGGLGRPTSESALGSTSTKGQGDTAHEDVSGEDERIEGRPKSGRAVKGRIKKESGREVVDLTMDSDEEITSLEKKDSEDNPSIIGHIDEEKDEVDSQMSGDDNKSDCEDRKEAEKEEIIGERVENLNDHNSNLELIQVHQDGPGRTAPIATALKLDRYGLGHSRDTSIKKAKVTHTFKEIREAQRKAKFGQHRMGIELGEKGKKRWKQRAKKDREESKRIMEMLKA